MAFQHPTASYHSTCLLKLAKHYIEARTLPPLEFCHFGVVLSGFSESLCFNEHKLNSPSKKGLWARLRNCRNYEVAARQMQTNVGDIPLFVNKQQPNTQIGPVWWKISKSRPPSNERKQITQQWYSLFSISSGILCWFYEALQGRWTEVTVLGSSEVFVFHHRHLKEDKPVSIRFFFLPGHPLWFYSPP